MNKSYDNEAASYEENPQEQQARWTVEFAAARKALEGWHGKGDEIDAEFRNERPNQSDFDTRLPLFTADILTIVAMLFGQVPKADVSRRFADSNDDVGRVAGEILERLLNTDIQRGCDTYVAAMRCCLMDFFLPGFGNAKCRYDTGEIESKTVEAQVDEEGKELVPGYTEESRPKEDVVIEYSYWKDWLWGPAKVVHQVPWWATAADMSRAKLVERFGALGKLVPLAKNKDGTEDPWSRARVWEIYDRDSRNVYWFVEAFTQVLDVKHEPLGLENFWNFPEPLVANLTTSKVVPRPYYALHRDQYQQINLLMTRIRELTDALRVSGCYDASNESLAQMLKPESRGRLIPVKNWAAITDGGGLRGAIDWFPVEMVAQNLVLLQGQLTNEIDLLHQTTGFSDIMRGEATQAGATATEQRVKTKFGSVRIQRLQDEIARFATDLLRIKAEIICRHFAPETIYERANVRFMPKEDQAIAQQAIQLLKSDFSCYRIEVKPEAVALADFAAMKQERMEVLTTLATYFQAAQPVVAAMPQALMPLLEVAQWGVAGVKGASQIEGVFDRMIQEATQAAQMAAQQPQQPPSNPQLDVEKAKQQTVMMQGQLKTQQEDQKMQNALAVGQAEVQNDAQREANQRVENVREAAQRRMVENALKPPPTPGRPM